MTRDDASIQAFARTGTDRPTTTFSLVLAAVTVATLSMHIDAIPKYSPAAFIVGIALTVACAIIVGRTVETLRASSWRTTVMLLLPTLLGASIGTVVQALVLAEVGSSWGYAIKDLGGLVSTREPIPWILGGVALGGLPAAAIAAFLLLAGRVLARTKGHDASESYGVAFVGAVGVLATFAGLFVDGLAAPPLLTVGVLSSLAVVVAFVIDGSRVRFLRRVYSGADGAFDIVPAERFASDATLAPMIGRGGASSVLVRVERVGTYRGAAAEPIAFLGDTEQATLLPLRRRRQTAAAMLVAMGAFAGLALLVHA